MRSSIPDSLLSLIHTKQNSTRLHIVNRERNLEGAYIPPDHAALSSPQLYSLDYTAYGTKVRVAQLQWDYFSEISSIKSSLLQARSLKILRLRNSSGNVSRQSWWTTGPECFTFDEGEKFPPLQEIRFVFEFYDMNERYCRRWAAAMDCGQLRRLDLDGGCPSGLIVALTGRVPQLKALFFGFRHSTRTYTWLYPSAEVFTVFSDSIDCLEDVAVTNDRDGGDRFHEISNAFFSKHGPTLKRLKVGYEASRKGWGESEVQGLAEKAPGIRNLALKIAAVGPHAASWVGGSTLALP